MPSAATRETNPARPPWSRSASDARMVRAAVTAPLPSVAARPSATPGQAAAVVRAPQQHPVGDPPDERVEPHRGDPRAVDRVAGDRAGRLAHDGADVDLVEHLGRRSPPCRPGRGWPACRRAARSRRRRRGRAPRRGRPVRAARRCRPRRRSRRAARVARRRRCRCARSSRRPRPGSCGRRSRWSRPGAAPARDRRVPTTGRGTSENPTSASRTIGIWLPTSTARWAPSSIASATFDAPAPRRRGPCRSRPGPSRGAGSGPGGARRTRSGGTARRRRASPRPRCWRRPIPRSETRRLSDTTPSGGPAGRTRTRESVVTMSDTARILSGPERGNFRDVSIAAVAVRVVHETGHRVRSHQGEKP